MQSVSSRIWTRVAVYISYDDNHYTTGTSRHFIQSMRVDCSNSVNHDWVRISSLLFTCCQNWTCSLQMTLLRSTFQLNTFICYTLCQLDLKGYSTFSKLQGWSLTIKCNLISYSGHKMIFKCFKYCYLTLISLVDIIHSFVFSEMVSNIAI